MRDKIHEIENRFKELLDKASKSQELEDIRIQFLGKKGHVQALMPFLKDCAADERPTLGKLINDLKDSITDNIEQTLSKFKNEETKEQLSQESLDVTLPGRKQFSGSAHPISWMVEKMLAIYARLGFSIQNSPEIESDYYNYGGLNYPEDHPARDMQDTFYLSKDSLLRSHTTSIQQRIMEKKKPPIRIVSYGKCYRNETITARSHVLFHQIDGLYIAKNVTFSDLLNLRKSFYSQLFNRDVEIRVRPSYFPFVEPGMEIDIKCTSCNGDGCRLCKHTGWLETEGAGMVHPEVLKQGGIDPEEYSGYAWGGGVERLFMLIYGIQDIRMFTENDTRFLSQFPLMPS